MRTFSNNGKAVTPSDTDFLNTAAILYVGTSGDVKVKTAGDDILTFKNVPEGTFLPVICKIVYSTDTTASNIVALW